MSGVSVPEEAHAKGGLDELRVLVVDDHDLFRTGLMNLLEEHGLHVVGEAPNGQVALRLVQELAPDVVIMDLNMPGMSGVETTREVTAIAPLTRVVVLTISVDDSDIVEAVMAGACGYLLKDSSIPQLLAGIRAAAAGESLISPQIAAKVLRLLRAKGSSADAATTIRGEHSDREIEVLRLIEQGLSNKEIAHRLSVALSTVKQHVHHILDKLEVSRRGEAVARLQRSGRLWI